MAGGTDVLLTTQYLDEADQLASQIVIVDHGRVIAAGTPSELKARAGREVVEVRPSDDADLSIATAALARLGVGEPRVDAPTRRIAVPVDRGPDRLVDAVRILGDWDVPLDDVGLRRPTLDEVFLSLTGHLAAEPSPSDPPTHAEPEEARP